MLMLRYLRCPQATHCGNVSIRKVREIGWEIKSKVLKGKNFGGAARNIYFIPVRTLITKTKSQKFNFKPQFEKDGVKKTFQFIYCNSAANYFIYGIPSLFCVATLVGYLVFKILERTYIYGESRAPQTGGVFGRYVLPDPVIFVTLALPFLSFLCIGSIILSRNVLLRAYYDRSSGQYAAVLLRYGVYRLPLRFKQEDIQICTNPTFRGNVSIKGKKMLLLEKDFSSVEHFNRFMGYKLDKSSSYLEELEKENAVEFVKKGLQDYQMSKYTSFEMKYREKRKMKRSK